MFAAGTNLAAPLYFRELRRKLKNHRREEAWSPDSVAAPSLVRLQRRCGDGIMESKIKTEFKQGSNSYSK